MDYRNSVHKNDLARPVPPLLDGKKSLILLKGIDSSRAEYLAELGILSAFDLLQQAGTPEQREQLATRLYIKEQGNITVEKEKWQTIYRKYVDNWVKQADLLRVEQMDIDTAYLLVELGVRHPQDLQQVDGSLAHPLLTSLANTQPNLNPASLEQLAQLIRNADSVPQLYIVAPRFSLKEDQQLEELVDTLQSVTAQEINTDHLISTDHIQRVLDKYVHDHQLTDKVVLKDLNLNDLSQTLKDSLQLELQDKMGHKITMNNSLNPKEGLQLKTRILPKQQIRTNGKIKLDPQQRLEHALRDYFNKQGLVTASNLVTLNIISTDPEPSFLFQSRQTILSGKQVIPTGLGYLKDVEAKLPLPQTFVGIAQIVRDRTNPQAEPEPLRNVQVTLAGLFGANMDKQKKDSGPSTYTDANGKFILRLPDNYNMQETLTLIFAPGTHRQEFTLSASEVLEHVAQAKVLTYFQTYYRICRDLKTLEEKQDNATELPVYQELLQRKEAVEADILKSSDYPLQDLEMIYKDLFTLDKLFADFTEEPFVLYESIFYGVEQRYPRVLPRVKLLENNDQPIYLPTDTAPSCIFNYGMLQRLVEPAISPVADKSIPRAPITSAIDIDAFKQKIAETPNSWTQMSSLGIGYLLNMHQAWIPDGFALGNLLYTLVLAPGEEQRLVVRENTQQYFIQDTSTGEESVSEEYSNQQLDNNKAIYDYALRQQLQGGSNSGYSTSTASNSMSSGASLIGFISAGNAFSSSRSRGNAFSSSRQSNAHNEISTAAQHFQHSIQTVSDRFSQAHRLSISLATSEQSDSVATRIIANHNHSHALTIQYWEVMRRYNLETCIEGVELVLFVPLSLISFTPNNKLDHVLPNTEQNVINRYSQLLKYADELERALPYKYRTGLSLIQKYLTTPNWTLEPLNDQFTTLTLTFKAPFLEFDELEATLFLKFGRARVEGRVSLNRESLPENLKTGEAVTNKICDLRRGNGKECSVTFLLPPNISLADLAYIRLFHQMHSFSYSLYEDPSEPKLAEIQNKGEKNERHIYRDNAPHRNPSIKISSANLKYLGQIHVKDYTLKSSSMTNTVLGISSSSDLLDPTMIISLTTNSLLLDNQDLQKMEQTYQHVVNNTMTYSQAVWRSLSADERALLLEQYSIDLDFENQDKDEQKEKGKDTLAISLLNCINVQKLLGFYGNCMLFPFTYPVEMAEKLGKTAAELQDALYHYHTNYFRVPSTTISLPTDGMIGEAVLSETNISEKIDLTRFWNWKDSPIDKMPITNEYLNATDYLADKTTKDITPMNLTGVTATTPVKAEDLIAALVNKQTPVLPNLTNLDNLQKILDKATDTTATGRDNALTHSKEMAKTAAEYAYKFANLRHKGLGKLLGLVKDDTEDSAAEADTDTADDTDDKDPATQGTTGTAKDTAADKGGTTTPATTSTAGKAEADKPSQEQDSTSIDAATIQDLIKTAEAALQENKQDISREDILELIELAKKTSTDTKS